MRNLVSINIAQHYPFQVWVIIAKKTHLNKNIMKTKLIKSCAIIIRQIKSQSIKVRSILENTKEINQILIRRISMLLMKMVLLVNKPGWGSFKRKLSNLTWMEKVSRTVFFIAFHILLDFLCIEDLTKDIRHPCMIDLKMGSIAYNPIK